MAAATAFVCAVFSLVYSVPVDAAIHACKQADGSVTFQDSACPVVVKKAPKVSSVASSIPFGLDKSWFEKPEVAPDRAICTEAGCHCDMYSRTFDSGLPLAVADALYLDGSWHRLDIKMDQLSNEPGNAVTRSDLNREIDEAACNILMSQQTLRLFGTKTLRALRDQKRYAEDRGLDNPDDCDAGDDLVCKYTDTIAIYERIQADIRSLKLNEKQNSMDGDTNDDLAEIVD